MESNSDLVIQVDKKSVSEIGDEIIGFLSQHDSFLGRNDRNTFVSDLASYLDFFNELRDWKRSHNPKDLSLSISIEASELLEIFQWSGTGSNKLAHEQVEKINEEAQHYIVHSAHHKALAYQSQNQAWPSANWSFCLQTAPAC